MGVGCVFLSSSSWWQIFCLYVVSVPGSTVRYAPGFAGRNVVRKQMQPHIVKNSVWTPGGGSLSRTHTVRTFSCMMRNADNINLSWSATANSAVETVTGISIHTVALRSIWANEKSVSVNDECALFVVITICVHRASNDLNQVPPCHLPCDPHDIFFHWERLNER